MIIDLETPQGRNFFNEKKILLTFICVLFVYFGFGQSAPPQYSEFIKKADSLFNAKNYKEAGAAYASAFQRYGWNGYAVDRYKAAKAWSLAGNANSAFYNLDKTLTNPSFSDYDRITNDSDLLSLHSDARWDALLKLIRENKKKAALTNLLDSMEREDQKWRRLWAKHGNKENDSVSLDTITKYWELTESLNYLKLKEIFSTYGYPNFDLLGKTGSHVFWQLIQHQDKHPQFQDSVLKAMKPEVDNGKASGADYAYLLDRVKVNSNKPQIYGTQMQLNKDSTSYEPKPVIEPDKLNERRKSIGLSTIEEYIEIMNKHNSWLLKKKD